MIINAIIQGINISQAINIFLICHTIQQQDTNGFHCVSQHFFIMVNRGSHNDTKFINPWRLQGCYWPFVVSAVSFISALLFAGNCGIIYFLSANFGANAVYSPYSKWFSYKFHEKCTKKKLRLGQQKLNA